MCKSLPTLPFELADASVKYEKAEGKTEEADDARRGGVGQDLRLDYRWIDLRVTAHNAIMRISSGVCTLFREFLLRFVPRLRRDGPRPPLSSCHSLQQRLHGDADAEAAGWRQRGRGGCVHAGLLRHQGVPCAVAAAVQANGGSVRRL